MHFLVIKPLIRAGHWSLLATTLLTLMAFAEQVVAQGEGNNADVSADSAFGNQVLSFLKDNCVDCHTAGDAQAGIELNGLRTREDALAAGKIWLRVLDAVDSGVMPPSDATQPARENRQKFIQWIENDWMSDTGRSSPAEVAMRRLNRREYDNTIRDLIGIDLGIAKDFPADDIAFGFDNIGSALKLSPTHIERYLDAAELVTQRALLAPDVAPNAPVELIGLTTYPLAPGGKVEFEHHLSPGQYMVEFSLVRAGIDEAQKPPRLLIGFGTDRRSVEAIRVQDETVMYRFWLKVAEGDAQVHVSLAPQPTSTTSIAESTRVGANVSGDQRYGNNTGLHVDSMVVRGPVAELAGQRPSSHQRILFCEPGFGDESRIECGRRVIARFAERAFRRPVGTDEIDQLMQIFRIANDHGESFERAVQIAITAILVSPKFLFLVEPETIASDRPLSQYELASRVSYFLWSSMPDEILLQSAARGTLTEELRSQVERMLADPKSAAFIENFVGQWLQLRNLAGVAPDRELFPEFDDTLRQAMRTETEQFFNYVLRENQSVIELLDSKYTFLNASLARLYRIEGIVGDNFRKVELSERKRGGLLTHASVLTLTSNHNRTSPVNRGQWILQQLLGTPPPPPPSDVPLLDESPQAAQSKSLRDRLEAHRASPQCASCHRQMDPMGFALENFDAIGRWRTADGEFEIDAAGNLPGDRNFEDAAGLKVLLASTEARKFSWCLIENMLTYALGRPLEASDFRTVEKIRRRLVESDYRMQEILFGIVESEAFQHRGQLPESQSPESQSLESD